MAEQILAEHGIYIRMRRRAEFEATRHLFDVMVWVDASERLPAEPGSSMELSAEDADLVLDNNRDIAHLRRQVAVLFG